MFFGQGQETVPGVKEISRLIGIIKDWIRTAVFSAPEQWNVRKTMLYQPGRLNFVFVNAFVEQIFIHYSRVQQVAFLRHGE